MSSRPVVFLGQEGSGKTNLYQEITKSKDALIMTKGIIFGRSSFGVGFEILDTPEFSISSQKKVLEYSACIAAALTEGPVNRVFIIVKFQGDCGKVIQAIEEILQFCTYFLNLVSIIVTEWDYYYVIYRKGDEFCIRSRLENKYGINSIIFVERNKAVESICEDIDHIILYSMERQLRFQFYQFHQQFDNISTFTNQTDKIRNSRHKIKAQFENYASVQSKIIDNFQSGKQDLADLMHQTILDIRKQAELSIYQFQQQNSDFLNEQFEANNSNIQYLHDIILKAEIWPIVNEIIKKAQSKILESGALVIHTLRRCPHCKLIWMKEGGCEEKVICGEEILEINDFPSDQFQGIQDSMPYLRYTTRTWDKKIDRENQLYLQKKEQEQQVVQNGFWNIIGWFQKIEKQDSKGCQKSFIWNEQPPLNCNDVQILKENKELFNYFTTNDTNYRQYRFKMQNI